MSDHDAAIESMLRDAAEARQDQARIRDLMQKIQASKSIWDQAGAPLTSAWRRATYGDPGYRPDQQQAVVGMGQAKDIDFDRSQLVLMKPRWTIWRVVEKPATASTAVRSAASMRKPTRDQYAQVHAGIYMGSETEAPLIAAEVFGAHVHEELVEPVAKRIDAIHIRMPDGADRVFERRGASLYEKRTEQRNGLIVRSLSPGKAA